MNKNAEIGTNICSGGGGGTEYNTGISIIRLFMSFVVVQDHFGTKGISIPQNVIKYFSSMAVPCFMFISFYLMANKMEKMSSCFLKKRYVRLEFPIILWAIVYFFWISFIQRGWCDWKSVAYQCIFGSSEVNNPPMWFLSSQIIVFSIMVLIFMITSSEESRSLVLIVTMVFCFFCQYAGINTYLFNGSPYESVYTLGRIIEVLPIAIAGTLWGRYEKKKSAYEKAGIVIVLLICSMLSKKLPLMQGYGYNGLDLFFFSCFLCMAMIMLPRMPNHEGLINYLAGFSMGIYCLHFAIGQSYCVLGTVLHCSFGQGTLIFDLIIWTTSLMISLFMGVLSKKIWIFKYMVM